MQQTNRQSASVCHAEINPSTLKVAPRHLAATISLLPVLAGCSGDAPATPNDFAGFPAFTLSRTPTLLIADDGTTDRQFTRISARRLPNGSIAVSDVESTRLMIFDRDGIMKMEVAHKGAGRRELRRDFNLSSVGHTRFTFERAPMSAAAVRVIEHKRHCP